MNINLRLSRAISSPHISRTFLNFYDPIEDDSAPVEPPVSIKNDSDLFKPVEAPVKPIKQNKEEAVDKKTTKEKT
jgi:hypothetical protein